MLCCTAKFEQIFCQITISCNKWCGTGRSKSNINDNNNKSYIEDEKIGSKY